MTKKKATQAETQQALVKKPALHSVKVKIARCQGQASTPVAVFADEHGMDFGRLIIGRKNGSQLQVVDMNDPATREKARKMQSQNDLESLFV